MKKFIFVPLLIIVLGIGCKTESKKDYSKTASNPEYFHRASYKLTEVIMHDIFNPPVASRIYAYTGVAAYEAMAAGNNNYKSLAGQLNGLKEMPIPEKDKEYCFPLASIKAYLKVGKFLIFSEDTISIFEKQIIKEYKELGISDEVMERSIAFGDTIAGAVIKWAKKDNYAQLRSAPKFTITQAPDRWIPTPPDYADALEPHWCEMRTMFMDSAAQFKPDRPTAFSIDKKSKFYKEAKEVYQSVKDSTAERILIGSYWDDSPNSTVNQGHVNFLKKKITPPGHWLNILKYACRQKQFDFDATVNTHARTAVVMYDAVISCWDEKFRSNVPRPETYISNYIESDWVPIIVTPPFPEYPSGHSVFSGAASTILTDIFGNNFAFEDSTELVFGLGSRKFASFAKAADEAAISRFYAGIHYMPAITNGVAQGRSIAKYFQSKIVTNIK
jgi:PAP2 superfamily